MTLGLSEARSRRRRRQRFGWQSLRWLVVLGIIGGAGAYSYNLGGELALQEVRVLEARIGELSEENSQLQSRLDGVGKAIRDATTRANELAAEVPSDEEKQLLGTIRERLTDGINPERLAFVLGAVSNQPECFGESATRRFVVRTELTSGGNETVSFADQTILVTASGATSRNADGQIQSWFDPAQPITVRFRNIDGSETRASGVLPMTHSVVVGDVEHRFALKAGQRSFIEVTADSCSYP